MDAGDSKSYSKPKRRIPNLWLPFQGLRLRVSVVLTSAASEGHTLAVAAPLAESVQNTEAYTLFGKVPLLTYIV